MPVQYGDGIRAEHVAVRSRGGDLRRLAHGRGRLRGPRRRGVPPARRLQRRLEDGDRQRAVRAALRRGRRRARRPLHLPPRAGPLPHGDERGQPRDRPRVAARARLRLRRRDRGRGRLVRDARRPGAGRARARAGGRRQPAAGAHDGGARPSSSAATCSSAAPATPARTASSCSPTPRTRPRCGTRSSAAAPCPRASPRATRCASRPAFTSTATTSRPSATRSRPASAGPARRTRASSGPRRCAPRASRAPSEKLVPFKLTGPGIARQGNPVVGGGEVTSGTMSPCLGIGIGMAYLPAERAAVGAGVRDRRARQDPPRGRRVQAALRQGDRWLKPSTPRTCSTTPTTTGRASRATSRRSASRGSRRTRSARSSSSTRPRSASSVTAGEFYAEVESVKAVSDVIAPLTGEIVEVNAALADTPEAINDEPYGDGWMVKVKLSDPSEADGAAGPRQLRERARVSRYTAVTEADLELMLAAIGVDSIEALFDGIPAGVRLDGEIALPAGQPEQAVYAELRRLAERNVSTEDELCFLGAGMYDHYVPAIVDMLMSRSEFLTPYTPVPARGQPGRAAGHVRVPDGDLRAHRPAGLQRLGVRGPERRRRRRVPREARDEAPAPARQPRRAPAQPRDAAHARGRLRHDRRRDRARRRDHRARRAAARRSATTSPR